MLITILIIITNTVHHNDKEKYSQRSLLDGLKSDLEEEKKMHVT